VNRFERYDRIAPQYGAMWPLIVPGYLPCLSAMFEVVRVRDQRPRDILDFGCGLGAATVAVAPACDPEARVTLVDGSPKMINVAEQLLGPRVHLAVCDDFREPDVLAKVTPGAAYDLVLCSFALHHWNDGEKRMLLEALVRSLKPGGMLLLADEVTADAPGGWEVVARVRARMIDDHLRAGRIPQEFVALESSLPPELRLPFRPSRMDEVTSWLAMLGLAVSCPVNVFGAALHLGLKAA
jgi:SAM-dependent methyltransferase